MELSLITPVKHIEWAKLLPGRFCIAPVALKHTEYERYFINASHQGYKVILDNGVFESDKVQDQEYLELARTIKPRVLVAPDTINASTSENYEAALKFIDLVKVEELNASLREPIELMFVPQCKKGDTGGFWEVISDAMMNEDIHWIGICRDAVYNAFSQYTHTEDQELNRFFFAVLLQKEYCVNLERVKWHFLGMGNRIDLLQYYWFVDTMDTASLFYQSTMDIAITNEFILPSRLKRPQDYFDRDFEPEEGWVNTLKCNCANALEMAQKADALRRRILGGRL